MPHDANGVELKVGDIVNMPFKVKQVHLSEEYCNLDLESCYKMYPSDNRTTLSAVNSRQVEKK